MKRREATPRTIAITALRSVAELELFERPRAVGTLPRALRSRLAVMLRDPELEGWAVLELGEKLREATRALGAALWVRDRIDVALAVDADGVHLGGRSVDVASARRLVGARWVSVACHSVADV